MKYLLLGIAFTCGGFALAQTVDVQTRFGADDVTFLEIKLMMHGQVANERYFIGGLPNVGDGVEYVYVGQDTNDPDAMRFQLRVRH